MKRQTPILSIEPGPSDWESSAPSTKPLPGTKVCLPILPYVTSRHNPPILAPPLTERCFQSIPKGVLTAQDYGVAVSVRLAD